MNINPTEDKIVNPDSTDPSRIRVDRQGVIYRESNDFLNLTIQGLSRYFLFETIDDQKVVLKPVPFHTNVSCWCSSQVDEYINFSQALGDDIKLRGAYLIDGHPWNYVFYNSSIKFIDFGSVKKGQDDNWFWREREQFIPLQKLYYITYCGQLRRRLAENVHEPAPIEPEEILRLGLQGISDNDCHTSYSERFARLTHMNHHKRLGRWIGYRDIQKDLDANLADDPRVPAIIKVLNSECCPKTVVDIGANDGLHSMFCASRGLDVLSIEIEDASACSLYAASKEQNASITVACSTLSDYLYHLKFVPEVFRPKADLALLLAIVHHMVHDFGYDFEKLLDELDTLSIKSIALEFIDYDDIFLRDRADKKSWYNIPTFIDAASRHRYRAEILEPHELGRRMIILNRPA